MELNPALTDLVFEDKRLVPAGYSLRIPVELRDKFLARYNDIPGSKKFLVQKGPKRDLTASQEPRPHTRRSKKKKRHS
jgi:hypothetical protein